MNIFTSFLKLWQLIPDGQKLVTHSSELLPVKLADGRLAMLKVSHEEDEKLGYILMNWWEGEGVAKIYAHQGDALLMERAMGLQSLYQMSQQGQDEEATAILCEAIGQLHKPRAKPLPKLTPLVKWFASLEPMAKKEGGIFALCWKIAEEQLANQQEIVPLHGDVHHENVLDFGERGWLVIDPKHLIGDRAFDYANIFCNPVPKVSNDPKVFKRRLEQVAHLAKLDKERLLKWMISYAGLSAAWYYEDKTFDLAKTDLTVAHFALEQLNNCF